MSTDADRVSQHGYDQQNKSRKEAGEHAGDRVRMNDYYRARSVWKLVSPEYLGSTSSGDSWRVMPPYLLPE